MAASRDANSTATFELSIRSGFESNARLLIKIDIVKPMPASIPIPNQFSCIDIIRKFGDSQ